MSTSADPLREHLVRLLEWGDAHVTLEAAIDGIPPRHRGTTAPGLPHSAWQLLEHLRLAQHDILDFCVNPNYKEMDWPSDYWPADPAPASGTAWNDGVAGYVRDREALKALVLDPKTDLFARIPHGAGQTCLREILLVADHNAYHVGQIVLVRRALGIWPGA